MPFTARIPAPAMPWPPEYSVRVSLRAKYARLRVVPGKGLEIVLPRGVSPDSVPGILERHKEWICKNLGRMHLQHAPKSGKAMPEHLALAGGTTVFPVRYRGDAPGEDAIVLPVPRSEPDYAVALLREWVRKYAAENLTRTVSALAEQFQLPYAGVRFRRQKSRWGSCTARKNLSLNICLIFLPPELCRFVLLHELAHTRQMNHGDGFWRLLFTLEPKALELDRRLRSGWKYVPAWMWE